MSVEARHVRAHVHLAEIRDGTSEIDLAPALLGADMVPLRVTPSNVECECCSKGTGKGVSTSSSATFPVKRRRDRGLNEPRSETRRALPRG